MQKLRENLWGLIGAGLASIITGIAVANTALPGVNSTLQTVFTYAYEDSPDKPTYSATSGAITLASTPTAVCTLQGSATKLVRVRRLIWSETQPLTAIETLDFIYRTAAPTAGQVQPTITPRDPNSAAATAVMEAYTSNPTVGAGIVLADFTQSYPDASVIYDFGVRDQAVILRNTSDYLEVNLNANTLANGTGYCTFEWTEE